MEHIYAKKSKFSARIFQYQTFFIFSVAMEKLQWMTIDNAKPCLWTAKEMEKSVMGT